MGPQADPTSVANVADHEPAIENELPAYRAILPMAVISLCLGLLSVFCFADGTFLIAAVGAVITGWLADQKVQRLPEIWTGRKLAAAGVGLGLIFGLSSVTIGLVQEFLRKQEASTFARNFEQVLQKGSVSRLLWYRMPPDGRKDRDPETALEQLKKETRDPSAIELQAGTIIAVKNRIDSDPAQRVEFVEIERAGVDGLDPYAVARYRLHGPPSKKYPAEEFAAAVMKAKVENGKYDWWVEEINYPYQPRTHVMKAKPVDDGHGHGPGGH